MKAHPPLLCLLAVFLIIGLAPTTSAQTPGGATEDVPAEVPAEAADAGAADAGSVAVATTFDPEAATEAYLARQSPEEKARSNAYFEGGYWLQLWSLLLTLGISWLLLTSRLSAKMRDLARRLSRFRPVQTTLYTAQYLVLVSLLSFPFTVYQGFFREHSYGLATQSFGAWFGEHLIGLAVALILAPIALIPLYGVLRVAPRTWWLWGSLIAILFLVLTIVISPVYIDPLFNTHEPRDEGPLKESILSLARSSGIEVDDIYRYDASRQTTRISANVSGLFGTMSIRLNDNLLERCSPAEVRAVMAHEIAHYVLHHIYDMIIVFAVVLVVGLALIRLLFNGIVARHGARWDVSGVADPAGLPLLAALLTCYLFLLTPVINNLIRGNEVEADLYGLQAAREPDGFAEVSLRLGDYRKLDPAPLEEWLLFDHPSGRSRIAMAMSWKAENLPEARHSADSDPPGPEPPPDEQR